jgi:NAD(P)H-hydrate epimerase
MELLATAEQMQGYDRSAIRGCLIPGLLLMENAGRAVVDELQRRQGPLAGKQAIVLCGKGNNGGDGFVIARHLASRGARTEAILLCSPLALEGDAAVNYRAVKKIAAARGSSLTVTRAATPASFHPSHSPDIVVDALFGTGFCGDVRGVFAKAIDWVNSHGSFVVAVDIPSGVNGTTGIVESKAVHADLTVTMALAKVGHYTGAGREHSGEVVVADIGMPSFLLRPSRNQTFRIEKNDVAERLPVRPLTAHKYSVGKVFVLGGSRNFTGAPFMAALSALRSGPGAVILGVPESLHPMLVKKLTEVILIPLPETGRGTIAASAIDIILEKSSWADAVALGPGLSRDHETDELLLSILPRVDRPVVIDADALTALARKTGLLKKRKAPTILTPHAGELARLIGQAADIIEARRVELARESARRLRCVLVLKGAPTVTAVPEGITYLNSTGNPGMATIGSGDVLTGVIAGLLAQGMNPTDAAWAGVWIHGRAGDIASKERGERGLLAMDILEAIPAALKEVGEAHRT